MPIAIATKTHARGNNNTISTMASNEGNLSSKELLQAQSHVWHDMFGFMRSFSLKCAIELGIPDAVHNHGKPIALTDLAAALSIPPCRVPSFRRLMGLLVHNGYFKRTDEDIYSLTPNSRVLVRDKGVSVTPIIEMVLFQPMLDPWQSLPAWLKNEQPPTAFAMCHGLPFWEAMVKMPELRKMMMEGLDSDSAIVSKVIIEDCADQFQGVKSLVEVAGNTGKIALAIAKAFPNIKCALLELPHVIDALEKSDVIEYVAGDMFEHIPPADVLILKWVLMTWNDDECVKILKRCKEAIPTKQNGGKAIIIDKVVDASSDGVHPKLTETQLYFDMEMMVLLTGKQRTENEWKKLFIESGFKEYKIISALGMRCIIEIYH